MREVEGCETFDFGSVRELLVFSLSKGSTRTIRQLRQRALQPAVGGACRSASTTRLALGSCAAFSGVTAPT